MSIEEEGLGEPFLSSEDFPFHEASSEWPLMGGAEQEALAQDIKARGQEHPVYLYGGKIIDGRNRYMACKRIAAPCRFVNWYGDEADIPKLLLSLNEHRRHLSVDWLRRRRMERLEQISGMLDEGMSKREIAAAVGVSPSQAGRDIKAAGGTRRRATSKRKTEPPVKDSADRVVPERLRDLFGDGTLADAAAHISSVLLSLDAEHTVETVAQKAEQHAHFLFASFSKYVDEAVYALSAAVELLEGAKPSLVCLDCLGEGCDGCKQAGYLSAAMEGDDGG